MRITDIVAVDIEHETRRNCALLPYQQVLIALQYYASGTFHIIVGDPLQISQSTACRSIHRVSTSLAQKIDDFVKFPNNAEAQGIKDEFFQIAQFPGVIGCVDGTHVWIISPHEHKVDFVNRKGYHSINVQVICDANGKWINIVARWPGSTHDSRMLRSSTIWNIMENGQTSGYILGDSGYPCRNWLMTPLLQPHGAAEQRYNSSHKRTRVLVEQSIGRWKRRFHVLHSENRMRNPENTCRVIAATAVLHNIAIDLNESLVDDIEPGQQQPHLLEYQGPHNGHRERSVFINTHFND
ncbi:putative nuclease HARBI1 [Gigantopelta aegis]|uniref:putative nuclease HARBI1 n=1 Tax=Gigantopelta aegis TaxID=1735272 RepID=UPI001B88DB71|nr:putative nuclease HARBI1 [Gigantopelta aegis]